MQKAAQCIVDAGFDKNICISAYGVKDTYRLGGFPTIIKGTPPFKIEWSTSYVYAGNLIVYASQFLNDTTVENPMVKIGFNDAANNKPIKFYLKITDGNQNIGIDSLILKFSRFGVLGIFREREINIGDSLNIDAGVGGGIPPLKYLWKPNYNISDTSIRTPIVWPQKNTLYYISVKDSANCPITFGGLEWKITIKSTQTDEIKHKIIVTVAPNPIFDMSDLLIQTNVQEMKKLRIYDIYGKLIYEDKFEEDHKVIGKEILLNGIYFYQIWIKESLVAVGKICKNY